MSVGLISGYISVDTGAATDPHAIPVPKDHADRAFDAATCIGCGACGAASPNASATLVLNVVLMEHVAEGPTFCDGALADPLA